MIGLHASANLRYLQPMGRLAAPFLAVGPRIVVGGAPLRKRMIVWASGEVGVDPPPPPDPLTTGHHPTAEEYRAYPFLPSFSRAFRPVF